MPNDNDLIRRGDLKDLLLKRSFFPAIVAAALKEIPAVDAVELPRGKVGEFVMMDNGYGEETAMIKGIAVTDEGLRYCFRFKSIPVDSPKIMRIMSREETEKWWEDFERERKDNEEI